MASDGVDVLVIAEGDLDDGQLGLVGGVDVEGLEGVEDAGGVMVENAAELLAVALVDLEAGEDGGEGGDGGGPGVEVGGAATLRRFLTSVGQAMKASREE